MRAEVARRQTLNKFGVGQSWRDFTDAFCLQLARELAVGRLVDTPELLEPPGTHGILARAVRIGIGENGKLLQPLDGSGTLVDEPDGSVVADIASGDHTAKVRFALDEIRDLLLHVQ